MFRSILLTTLAAAVLAHAQTPSKQGQLDANETLFTVLAAINAAGYDAEVDSAANYPIRKQVREAIASKNLQSVAELKKFYQEHHQANAEADLSQYISFALSLSSPPEFEITVKPEEMPLDVRPLLGLEQLLTRFYQEANINDLWKRSQPAYDSVIARYHTPVTQSLFEANAYLRNPTSGAVRRRFQIYIDLLGAPNQIQTRSYKDDYYVVVTPSPEPQVDEVRHAYLHYLLDPLALRHFEQLNRLKGLADFAQPAPALSDAYKEDFVLFATESLIKAVESRLAHGAPNRQALVDQALHEGFVLTPALADGLAVYEKQEEAFRLYYITLVGEVDLAHEDKRLEKVQFAKQSAVKKAKPAPVAPEPVLTGVAKTMARAEELYGKRDLDGARGEYRKVLQETSEAPLHARAYYGLARIAALQRDPELAEKLFEKTLELSPDTSTKSYTYLYLARLADAAGDREQAAKHYRAILAIADAPPSVRSAAEKGLAQPFQK